jgi:hypothetical protein
MDSFLSQLRTEEWQAQFEGLPQVAQDLWTTAPIPVLTFGALAAISLIVFLAVYTLRRRGAVLALEESVTTLKSDVEAANKDRDAHKAEEARLEVELATRTEELQVADADIEKLEAEKAELAERVEAQASEYALLDTALAETRAEADRANQTIEELNQSVATLEMHLQDARKAEQSLESSLVRMARRGPDGTDKPESPLASLSRTPQERTSLGHEVFEKPDSEARPVEEIKLVDEAPAQPEIPDVQFLTPAPRDASAGSTLLAHLTDARRAAGRGDQRGAITSLVSACQLAEENRDAGIVRSLAKAGKLIEDGDLVTAESRLQDLMRRV